ncbi:MAG: hypothetical protein ACREJ3_03915 [Polyangiaceae bacterium]
MSKPDARLGSDPVRGWQYAEELVADDSIVPLDVAAGEAETQGATASPVPSARALIEKATRIASARSASAPSPPQTPERDGGGAPVVVTIPNRSRWAWRASALLAAAAIAGIGVAMMVSGVPITSASRPDRVTARASATKLRDEAFAACASRLWDRCEANLDEARGIDPQGESTPQVQQARRDIVAARAQR